jgi:hypothetical protein
MSGLTTQFSWPYPTNGDVANVASDEQTTFSAIDASMGNSFTAYTPVCTSTGTAFSLGNGTIVGRFKKFGKWGFAVVTLDIGGTTTVGTGSYRFTLPAGWTLFDSTTIYGSAMCIDASVPQYYVGICRPASTTLMEVFTHSATSAMGATVPFAVASGDRLQLHMRVELA